MKQLITFSLIVICSVLFTVLMVILSKGFARNKKKEDTARHRNPNSKHKTRPEMAYFLDPETDTYAFKNLRTGEIEEG